MPEEICGASGAENEVTLRSFLLSPELCSGAVVAERPERDFLSTVEAGEQFEIEDVRELAIAADHSKAAAARENPFARFGGFEFHFAGLVLSDLVQGEPLMPSARFSLGGILQ